MGLEDHEVGDTSPDLSPAPTFTDRQVCYLLDGVADVAENDRTAEDILKLSRAIAGVRKDEPATLEDAEPDEMVVFAPGAKGYSLSCHHTDTGMAMTEDNTLEGCFAPVGTTVAGQIEDAYQTEERPYDELNIVEDYDGSIQD